MRSGTILVLALIALALAAALAAHLAVRREDLPSVPAVQSE